MSASLSRLTAVGAAALMLALAGCAGPSSITATRVDEPSDTTTVSVGQCLDGTVTNSAGTVDPDHDAVVPCTEPHAYEVIAVEPLPDHYLVDSDDLAELDEQRDRLISGDLRPQYRAWATSLCIAHSAIATGLSDAEVEDANFAEAVLRPLGAFTTDISLTSAERWAAGEAALVCAIRHMEPLSSDTSPIVMPDGMSFADVFGQGFPQQARVCYTFEPWGAVACTEPHWMELFAAFDVLALGDADLVARLQAVSDAGEPMARDDEERLDEICAGVLEAVAPESDEPHAALAVTGHGWTPDTAHQETRDIWCGLVSKSGETHDAVGSFFDGPGAVTLVPIA